MVINSLFCFIFNFYHIFMSQSMIQIINQVHEISRKMSELGQLENFQRNLDKFQSLFQDAGYFIQDPISEKYSESRSDCEASIVGKIHGEMKISKTIKPIVYHKVNDELKLVQKGIVIVE